MTARHQLRFGSRRLGRERAVIDATPAPSVGEMLYAARERKGVDLYRAERDTKIRLKYLEALEDDALDELPPPVYTKGFLRNYALYLGLNPEEVIERWREQSLGERKSEKVVVAPPPQPLAAPRRGLAITPNMLVGLMLSAAVLAFLGYIGWQVLRFVDAPGVAVTFPPTSTYEINAESITLTGTAGSRARVSVLTAGGQTLTTVADEAGAWSLAVPLSLGANPLAVNARDPVTERDAPNPVNLLITVPLPQTSPSASPVPTQAAITLTLSSPLSGATSSDGLVTVSGTTSGTRVTIVAEQVVVAPSPAPGVTPAPSPEPPPSPGASPAPGVPPSLDITVPPGGAFSEQLQLAPGAWLIRVTGFATGLEPVEQTRTVTVGSGGPIGEGAMTLVLTAEGGDSWLRLVADGTVLPGRQWGGPVLNDGETVTVTGDTEIFIRSGNAGNVRVTLNGVDLGRLGERGQVGNWIIVPGEEPQPTTESR